MCIHVLPIFKEHTTSTGLGPMAAVVVLVSMKYT